MYGVPFVLTMHGTERVRHGGQLPSGTPSDVNSIEWWLAFRADRLISPTKFMVEQLITGFELPPELVARVPNGIDPERVEHPAARNRSSASSWCSPGVGSSSRRASRCWPGR